MEITPISTRVCTPFENLKGLLKSQIWLNYDYQSSDLYSQPQDHVA